MVLLFEGWSEYFGMFPSRLRNVPKLLSYIRKAVKEFFFSDPATKRGGGKALASKKNFLLDGSIEYVMHVCSEIGNLNS